MTYFHSCTTAEEVKNEYRRLCKQHHPDLGTPEEKEWRTKTMQQINLEYAQQSAMWRQAEMREKARAQGKPEPTEQDFTNAAEVDERIRAAIEQIIRHAYLDIEICGLWVWVSGTSKRGTSPENDAALDDLHTAQFRWASKKKMWYFAGVPGGGHREFDMSEIRDRYGSQHVTPGTRSRQPKQIEEGATK